MKKKKIPVGPVTLKRLTELWLADNWFDGLYNDEGCGCTIDDLMPCGEPKENCHPGHKIPCDPDYCEAGGGCEFHIASKVPDDEWPSNYICNGCAIKRGGTWPKGHTATIHTGICSYCGEEKALANTGDWNWPDKVRRGMRD